jgi:dinuclear metal center YbgI/SA1388 family protein
MLNTKTLLTHFGKDFPKRLAEKYHDYVGLMVGPLPTSIQKVVVTLDLEYMHQATLETLKPDLVITHHPFIYGPKGAVLRRDERKRHYVTWLQAQGIAVYSLHTNFDEGRGGMNDALASALNLQNIQPLLGDPMARGGQLHQPMAMEAFVDYVRQQLHLPYSWYLAEGASLIHKVALVGGGGSRSYAIAQQEGYDCFLSGDAPHHVRRSIVNDHYNYVELAHEIEEIFLPVMKNYLLRLDPQLTVLTPFQQALPRLSHE